MTLDRRQFIGTAAALAATTALPSMASAATALPQGWAFASLAETAEQVRQGAVSPVALTEAMLTRIDTLDKNLHSYINVTGDMALAQAAEAETEIARGQYRGPLQGISIGWKDLLDVKGTPTTFGSPAYRDHVPEENATVVDHLEEAGAVFIGRHHLLEGASTEHNPAFGPKPVNPFNPEVTPGGSSSGTGVAVAAGLCFAGLGSDTGGSIRFPSSLNGLTGLKPTWSRVSRKGVLTYAETLDVIGPMARSAEDAAIVLKVIAGADPRDPTSALRPVPDYVAELDGATGARDLRIGFDLAYCSAGTEAQIITAMQQALAAFADLGARVVPITMPDTLPAAKRMIDLQYPEMAGWHEKRFDEAPELFGKGLADAIRRGRDTDPVLTARAYIEREYLRGHFARLFEQVDLIVTPVLTSATMKIKPPQPDETYNDFLSRIHGFTAPYSMTGMPALIVPVGMTEAQGTPIGMQIVGPHFEEGRMLRAAHAFQQVTDWHLRHPALA